MSSTSEQVREELPPSPLDIISAFEEAHQELVKAGRAAKNSPSDETLDELEERRTDLRRASSPLVLSDFFKDSGNNMLTDAGVGALVLSGDNLSRLAKALSFDGNVIFFKDDLREELTNSIHSGDFSYFTEGTSDELLEGADNKRIADTVLIGIGNSYLEIIDQYYEAVCGTASVQEFMEAEQQELESLAYRFQVRTEKIQQVKLLGGVLVAAFAGTYLANKLQKRG